MTKKPTDIFSSSCSSSWCSGPVGRNDNEDASDSQDGAGNPDSSPSDRHALLISSLHAYSSSLHTDRDDGEQGSDRSSRLISDHSVDDAEDQAQSDVNPQGMIEHRRHDRIASTAQYRNNGMGRVHNGRGSGLALAELLRSAIEIINQAESSSSRVNDNGDFSESSDSSNSSASSDNEQDDRPPPPRQ